MAQVAPAATPAADPEVPPAPPVAADRRRWIFATVAVGILLGSFTNSALNAVLPVIREDFQAPVTAVQWVLMSFLLVNSSLQLSMGRLGDLIGHRRVYFGGLGVFCIGILLALTAASLPWLIGARIAQAIGSAMLVAVGPAITTLAFPPHQRGRVLGLQATTVYVGLALGPSVGGLITDRLGWRAVFFVCLPLAALTAVLAWRFVPSLRAKTREGRFDVLGALLFMSGLIAFLYALSRGGEWGWLTAPTLGLIALATVLLTGFVLWEARYPWPMLDLGLFRIRLFRMAVISSVLNFICFYSIFFLMPFYLIAARGWSAGQAGLIFMALPISMALIAPFSGLASDRIGSRVLASSGMTVLAAGLIAIGLLGEDTPPIWIAACLILCGIGIGLFTSPNNSAIMGSAPIERRGVASGVVGTARSVGMVLGISLSGALLTTLLVLNGGTVDQAGPPFFAALHWTCWAIAVCAILGALTSYSRGGAKPAAPAGAAGGH